MKMRPLVIDEQLRAEVATIVSYANAHHYIIGESPQPPGDDPMHVITTTFGYRCVFSFTRVANGQLYRDLSISVLTKGKWPHPYAVLMLADLFGFTGWDQKTMTPPKAWLVAKDIHFDAVRIVQPIEIESHEPIQ
jgi:hypothetical protein